MFVRGGVYGYGNSSFPAEDPSVILADASSPFRGAKLTNNESWLINLPSPFSFRKVFLPSLVGKVAAVG